MTEFASRILDWYASYARPLPWRRSSDPYRVWISEVMLQQTRVETVKPYYDRWMARFPSIRELAAATEGTVLRLWEGLGYYARARNLHRASRLIVRKLEGEFPSDVDLLRTLPGVGPYTAAAIASIAFHRDEPTLDANIRRVLSRAFDVRTPVHSRRGEQRLLQIATAHLPEGKAADFNQALMDLGATVCLPREPQCDICPVGGLCLARKHQRQESLPVRAHRAKIPHFTMGAAVVMREDHVLIRKRPSGGLLGGLWEFPKATISEGARSLPRVKSALPAAIRADYSLTIRNPGVASVVRHAYSHFTVTVYAFPCTSRSTPPLRGLRWIRIDRLRRYPMGKVDRTIAEQLKAAFR